MGSAWGSSRSRGLACTARRQVQPGKSPTLPGRSPMVTRGRCRRRRPARRCRGAPRRRGRRDRTGSVRRRGPAALRVDATGSSLCWLAGKLMATLYESRCCKAATQLWFCNTRSGILDRSARPAADHHLGGRGGRRIDDEGAGGRRPRQAGHDVGDRSPPGRHGRRRRLRRPGRPRPPRGHRLRRRGAGPGHPRRARRRRLQGARGRGITQPGADADRGRCGGGPSRGPRHRRRRLPAEAL